jgi:hypothetical protein
MEDRSGANIKKSVVPSASIFVRNFKIEIDEKRILRLIGYKKRGIGITASIRDVIAEERVKLDRLLEPVSVYRIIDHEETNKHPIFSDAEMVAFCLCTIGPRLEQAVKTLITEGEILRSLILDALGSEAVEDVATQSDRIIAEKALKMHFWPSKRYSPGYKNWMLEEQRFIFGILPAVDIGVKLHEESCMMIPRKSISFRINFYLDKNLTTRKINKKGVKSSKIQIPRP